MILAVAVIQKTTKVDLDLTKEVVQEIDTRKSSIFIFFPLKYPFNSLTLHLEDMTLLLD